MDAREPLLLRCHGNHWFDLARLEREPHPSPIRRVPLLYNIWDDRAEGLATGMEELAMSAGLYAERPRSRELVYVMLAQRAARAIAEPAAALERVDARAGGALRLRADAARLAAPGSATRSGSSRGSTCSSPATGPAT